ncbi:MAG: hypothetical protein AAFX02_07545, partial [Pseudomonadota bacterium]
PELSDIPTPLSDDYIEIILSIDDLNQAIKQKALRNLIIMAPCRLKRITKKFLRMHYSDFEK